jgi:hypothetical protein
MRRKSRTCFDVVSSVRIQAYLQKSRMLNSNIRPKRKIEKCICRNEDEEQEKGNYQKEVRET